MINDVLIPGFGILFSLLLIIIFFSKKRINLPENKMYMFMIISVFVDSVMATLLQIFGLNGVTKIEQTLVNICNKIDFASLIIYSTSFFLYYFIISIKDKNKGYKFWVNFFYLIDAIIYLIILFEKIDIITEGGHYSIAFNLTSTLTFALCLLYIISSILISIFNINIKDKRYIPIYMIFPLVLILFLLFKLNPYLVLISLTLTFSNYIMFFTIENPDMKLINELEIANQQAEKSNRAKTDFLSSMSHEIRTPLNAIKGFSEMILESKNIKDAKENVNDIINASNTLLEIVNGILDISKIESGKLNIVNTEYNPKELFIECKRLIEPRIKEKAIDFNLFIAKDIPNTLKGDYSNIKKCILNILTNAAKYTDKGFIKFEISCVNHNDICTLLISVEDTGRGIKKEDLAKLFEKFERFEETRNTTIEGTGLGLAITKQLIDLMGGKIVVQSIYKSGSKFTLRIPQKISDGKTLKVENVKEENIDLKGKNILIVDDNLLNLKVADKILKKYNANTKLLESGFDCIEEITKNKKYDLILLDDMMPQKSGTQTLKELKKIPDFKIPVIALTANAIEGMREKYLKAGFDEYLAKPIEKEYLNKILNKFLK